MKKKGGAHVAADTAASAPASGTQTPPTPNSKRSLKKALAKAKGKAPKAKAKKDGSCSVAIGSTLVASGSLVKGGVLGMLAAGANAMCERPQSVDYILSQLSAIPGCVEYTSLLDSYVENGTYDNITNDREDDTSLCKIAGPQYMFNWKGGACIIDSSSPKPDLCSNIGCYGPCCFVGLDLNVKGGN